MELKENVSIQYNEKIKKTIINIGTKEYTISDTNKKFFSMLHHLQDIDKNTDLFKFLAKYNLLKPNLNLPHLIDRTKSYIEDNFIYTETNPSNKINEILNIPLTIIGCGGVGTVVLDNLARTGFKKFILIDNDVVEESNFNRQLFYDKNDLGQHKVDVLAKKIKSIHPLCDVQPKKMYISNQTDLNEVVEGVDSKFIINCADTPTNIENIVADVSKANKSSFISAYVGITTGTISPIYDDVNHFLIEKNKVQTPISVKGSLSMTNMITASYLSKIIFDYLMQEFIITKYSFYVDHIINFEEMKIENIG